MIRLKSITHTNMSGITSYVLPGRRHVYSALEAVDALDDIFTMSSRNAVKLKQLEEERKNRIITKHGAVLTRRQSTNSRYFLGGRS